MTGYTHIRLIHNVFVACGSDDWHTGHRVAQQLWCAGSPVVVVEACTDLVSPDWVPVGTNTLSGGSAYFSDPQ